MVFCPKCGFFVKQKTTSCPKCNYTEKPDKNSNPKNNGDRNYGLVPCEVCKGTGVIKGNKPTPKNRGKPYKKLLSDATTLAVPGKVWIYAGTNAGKYIEDSFFKAEKSAHVCSPWISEEYVVKMNQMADEGVDVKIITQDNHWNTDTTDLIRKYNTHSNFNYRIFPKGKTGLIHTKLYIVDGHYAVFGSANFTKAALWGTNHELVTISDSVNEAKTIEDMFSKLWKTKIQAQTKAQK